MTLTTFVTACAVFVGAAQGLKLQHRTTTVSRVVQYPQPVGYDAPVGLLATEYFINDSSNFEGKYEE